MLTAIQDLDWESLNAVLPLLLPSLLGGGSGAWLTNRQLGRQHSQREDRKRVLDEWLPNVLSLASKRHHAVGTPSETRDQLDENQYRVWRTLQRTSWRDRRNWSKYFDTDANADWRAYNIAHHKFEWYLHRQFDPLPIRAFRWLSDRDRLIALEREIPK